MSEVKTILDNKDANPVNFGSKDLGSKGMKPVFIVKNYSKKKKSPKSSPMKKKFLLEKKTEIVQRVNWVKTVQLNEQDFEEDSNECPGENANSHPAKNEKSNLKKGLLLGGLIGGSMGLYYYLQKN